MFVKAILVFLGKGSKWYKTPFLSFFSVMIWQSEWQWQIIYFLGLSLSAMMEAQFFRIRFRPKLYHAIKSFITWFTFFITWKKPVKYDNLLCHFQHTKCDTIRVSVSWNLSKYSLFSFPTNIWISNSDYSTWFLSSKCFNMTPPYGILNLLEFKCNCFYSSIFWKFKSWQEW